MADRTPGAGRQLLRDKRIYIAVILIGAWIVGSVIARPFYDRLNDDDDDDNDETPRGENYVQLAPLVAASSRIMIATFEEELTPGTGEAGAVTRRQYAVVETLKTSAPGSTIEVWGDPGPGEDGRLALEPGTNYVLFLVEREINGSQRLSAPGEPSVAAVNDDGTLTFIVSNRYADDMQELGWTTGTQRVPFTATLAEVHALIGTP